jgi:hypothetical protein
VSTAAPILAAGPQLVQVCAWCQSVIRVAPLDVGRKTELSHGMCSACVAKQQEQLDQLRAIRSAVDRKMCRCCSGYFVGARTGYVCEACEKEVLADLGKCPF